MKFEKITITHSPDGGLDVFCDENSADSLTPDEALGAIASILFGGFKGPMFLRSPEYHKQKQKYGSNFCSTCGHDKRKHIYEEGACRPGFICDCQRFEQQLIGEAP